MFFDVPLLLFYLSSFGISFVITNTYHYFMALTSLVSFDFWFAALLR